MREGSGESAHLHRLTLYSLRHCTKISHAASNGDLCAIQLSSEDSGESAHFCRYSHLTMRYVSRSSHALAAKALGNLHIYTGSPEPHHSTKIQCAGSNGNLMLSCASGESAHLHRLTLYSHCHCTKISHATSNGDLCAIHISSVDSDESAHFRRHGHWTMR